MSIYIQLFVCMLAFVLPAVQEKCSKLARTTTESEKNDKTHRTDFNEFNHFDLQQEIA